MSNRTQRSLGLILMVAVAVLPALAADTATGKAVYDKKCKVCHGANGEGNPGMAKVLKVTFTPLSSAEVQKTSDADLKKIITKGKDQMKPVTGLSDVEIDHVIAFVRSLKK